MKSTMRLCVFAFAALAAAGILAPPAGAAETVSEYRIAFLGLPIARASFRVTTTGRDYKLAGSFRTAGLADIVDSTRGQTAVIGKRAKDRFQASEFFVSYTSGKTTERYEVEYVGGNVKSARRIPERSDKRNWVNVSKSDMRAVFDPVSGLLFPPDVAVCPRTVPVFDGEMRLDFKLVPKGKKRFKTDGFEGEATVCGIRFVPKSGYRKDNSSIEYLRRSTGMEIWFAYNPVVDMVAPVYARIPTKIGIVTVKATRYGRK